MAINILFSIFLVSYSHLQTVLVQHQTPSKIVPLPERGDHRFDVETLTDDRDMTDYIPAVRPASAATSGQSTSGQVDNRQQHHLHEETQCEEFLQPDSQTAVHPVVLVVLDLIHLQLVSIHFYLKNSLFQLLHFGYVAFFFNFNFL